MVFWYPAAYEGVLFEATLVENQDLDRGGMLRKLDVMRNDIASLGVKHSHVSTPIFLEDTILGR
jgi:hypothetical protein